jgi:orotate phosphoribosyltransferase
MRALITQEELWELFIRLGAVLEGHFVLTSGRHGDAYVNKDVLFTDPFVIDLLAMIIASKFAETSIGVVAGPTVGAVTLANRVAFWLIGFSRKQISSVYVDEGPDKTRILKRGFDKEVEGNIVLLVEDVMTTAGSVIKSRDTIIEAGGLVEAIAVLVNRDPVNNTAETIGVPELFCLIEKEFPSWEEDECPLCKKYAPIDTRAGKGREYLAKKEAERRIKQ